MISFPSCFLLVSIHLFLQKGAMTRKHLPPGSKVLFVGCGTGIEAIYCAQTFPDVEVTVVDIAPKMLEQLKRRKDKVIPYHNNLKMVSKQTMTFL